MYQGLLVLEAEKADLIDRAVDLQKERPDLSGLPLLREAMLVLPADRRRKLLTLNRADWFEPGVRLEVKRRHEAATAPIRIAIHEEDPYVPFLKGTVKAAEEWRSELSDQLAQQSESLIAVTTLILRELQALNAKFGSPVRTLCIAAETIGDQTE